MEIFCPECGHPFDDGDQCWVCVARNADIEETFTLCFPVALGALTIGNILATGLYPPLKPGLTVLDVIPAVSFFITVVSALALQERITRYAGPVRLMIVVATVTVLYLQRTTS